MAGRADLVSTTSAATICPYIGAKLAPFEAWLLLRGLRTLPVAPAAARGRGADAGAAPRRGARRRGPCTTRPSPARCRRASTGTSGLFSFVFDESVDIPAFCDALELFKLGVSWGGHESLVVPALVTRVQAAGPNSAVDFGVPERMVRLHVGLEGTEALWARSRPGARTRPPKDPERFDDDPRHGGIARMLKRLLLSATAGLLLATLGGRAPTRR